MCGSNGGAVMEFHLEFWIFLSHYIARNSEILLSFFVSTFPRKYSWFKICNSKFFENLNYESRKQSKCFNDGLLWAFDVLNNLRTNFKSLQIKPKCLFG